MTITKIHLIESIHNRLDLSKSKSGDLVGSLFEIMKTTLASGEDILISGFGKFCLKEKHERQGRNPATGERLMLDSRRIVTFSCSPVLKGKLSGKK